MQRDETYLLDIMESAQAAIEYVSGMDRNQFIADEEKQDAVVRRLEVLGEAAKRVSQATRGLHPHLPWKEMINMRNRMIHEYDQVDLDIVWDTVQKDLLPLIAAIKAILPVEE